MRWRSVAIAGALWPAAAGCNIAHNAARNIVNEPHVVWTQHAITHDLRKSAKAAWEASRGECPEHADSSAFRDGFIDGYVDYLDRGGNASLPAVPPAKYTRHKEYFTENGQCLVKEYFLGFKMGQEVAIATGRRQILTVPVLLPQEPTGPPAFTVQPAGTEPPPAMIPPQPPVDTTPSSGAASDASAAVAPPVAAPLQALSHVSMTRAPAKTPPPVGFGPVVKPLSVAEAMGKRSPSPEYHTSAVLEPERFPVLATPPPLPAQSGPSGPRAWGDLPAIPAMPSAPPVATPQLPPPIRMGRPQLPPNHPQPRE